MKKVTILLIVLGIFLSYAQTVDWSKTYFNDFNPSGNEIGNYVFENNDGSLLVIGSSTWMCPIDSTLLELKRQFFITRTDEFGNELDKNLFGEKIVMVSSAFAYSEDTVLVTGVYLDSDSGSYWHEMRILEIEDTGDSIFCSAIDSIDFYLHKTGLTNDNCLISVTRKRIPESSTTTDTLILFKHTVDGEIMWLKEYEIPFFPSVVKSTMDNGFIIGAVSSHLGSKVIKTDSLGDTLWTTDVMPSITSIVETSLNEFLCLGVVSYSSIGLCRISDLGHLDWTRMWVFDITDTSFLEAYSLIPTFDGNFVFCGQTGGYTGTAGESDGFIMKVDSLANVIWQRRVDVAGRPDVFNSVIQTQDSGYVCTGYSSVNSGLFPSPETLDVCLVKFTKDGTPVWENDINLPQTLSLSAQPNPFNSAVRITIETPSLSPSQAEEMPQAEGVVVEIFDLNGRRIETPRLSADPLLKGVSVDGLTPLTKGGQGGSFIWQPAAAIGSGVYLVRAKTDGGATATKRVVYLK